MQLIRMMVSKGFKKLLLFFFNIVHCLSVMLKFYFLNRNTCSFRNNRFQTKRVYFIYIVIDIKGEKSTLIFFSLEIF